MPRLRSLPAGFTLRNRGFRSPEKSLAESSASGKLLAEYELACRAGKAIMPLIDQLRLPLDFSSGRGVRINAQGTITFITDSAAQQSRLRNLSKRILENLVTAGVPVVAVDFRNRGRRSTLNEAEKPEPIRTPSLIAAAELESSAARLINPDLKHQILALAAVLRPRPEEMPLAVETALEGTIERIDRLIGRTDRIKTQLPSAPDAKLIPDEASAKANPVLAAVRSRQRARLARRTLAETETNQIAEEARQALALLKTAREKLMPPAAEELPFELSSKVLDDAGQSAVSAALKIAGWTARLNQVEDRLTLPLEEAVQTLAAKGTTPAAASPSLPNAGSPEALSPAVLRSELKRKIKVLQSKLSETLSQIRHIGVRMPELPDILSADSRLAQEAADLARAREKGDSQALAAALSAESSRKLLSWESRLEVKSRLGTLEQTLAAMSKRFQTDRPWLLAPRSKYADERPETMETLRKIDRRLINEEEALSSMSAEIETLAEKVEILRRDLPDDALSGINPLEGALLESLKIVFARLRSLKAVLGGRLNESIIPSEREAEADPQLAAIRTRQLARLKTWDNRAALLAAAEQSAAAVDRVLTAPRGEGLSPELAAMLERAAAEVVERFEAARAAIDPDAKPLELPDLFGAPMPADDKSESAALCASQTAQAAEDAVQAAAEAEEAQQLELRTKLEELLTIIPIWADRLPRMPDPKLIPNEAECAGNPQLSELRGRMLSRRSRREDLQARLSSLHEAALKLREHLGNPLADTAETGRYAAALMRDADRFSADLGK
ncbi:hypothetical protein [Sutterella wadsworthensis]|uniref:hypothetical protein n=1 Tax=Sutterella wadsworthensis TaxID=40545 RepID=UPI00265AAA86|nr:hypothetical protein [Sutterella wadsworthensis]